MKKFFHLSSIVIPCAVLLCACTQMPEEIPPQQAAVSVLDDTRQESAPQMTAPKPADALSTDAKCLPTVYLDSVTKEGCTIILRNDTPLGWSYGKDFVLRDADTGEKIPFLNNIAFTANALGLPAGEIEICTIDFAAYFDALPAGDYILEKELFRPFEDNGQLYTLTVEMPFQIPS